jgi:CBS domain-containing protein
MRPLPERAIGMSKEACGMNPIKEVRVRDFMMTKPIIFSSDTDLLDAIRVLVDRRISGAPVVDARGNLVGVLTERDFLKAAWWTLPTVSEKASTGAIRWCRTIASSAWLREVTSCVQSLRPLAAGTLVSAVQREP